MRSYAKIIMILFIIMSLFACENKSQLVFLEKDGELYEIADQVSFYYPKTFSMNITSENKNMIEFVNDQEMMTYMMIVDDSDNQVEEMPALYAGQLEQEGAVDVEYHSIEIESGLKCYEFTGMFQATGMKFKHLVYFTLEASYSLGYQAPDKLYDGNVEVMTQYLTSLIVS